MLLGMYNYNPGIKAAHQTVRNITVELKEIGEIKTADPEKFAGEHFTTFSSVPESYVCNADGSFTEVW